MEYYSATKKNEIMSFARKLMELETIMLSKNAKTKWPKFHLFSFICGTYT
jgi:hypothetical protein